MKTRKKLLFVGVVLLALLLGSYFILVWGNPNPQHQIGDVLDDLNGVKVYYNGGVGNVSGRNTTADGYNLGLKYQCVEFIKRYFYERYKHKMPDAYGHAKDFFDLKVEDGLLNKRRGMFQFANAGSHKPQVDDLLVFDGTILNRYGHVAIISQVSDSEIEIIQQNSGPFGQSRITIALLQIEQGRWQLQDKNILGFLRLPQNMK